MCDKLDLLHRKILEEELESTGIRLNRTPPDIYFKKKKTGGIKFNSMVPLTKIGSDPASVVHKVLQVLKNFFSKNNFFELHYPYGLFLFLAANRTLTEP